MALRARGGSGLKLVSYAGATSTAFPLVLPSEGRRLPVRCCRAGLGQFIKLDERVQARDD